MNSSIRNPKPGSRLQPSNNSFPSQALLAAARKQPARFSLAASLAVLLFLLFSAPSARAHQSPTNCSGSGLGINMFTSSPDVHIGDTLTYDLTIFNGITNSGGRVVCDATAIVASLVTPDGITHPIALSRTALSQGEFNFYPAVVSYVVRAQDVLPDGTVRSTAQDDGLIHQNDTDSHGGGFQGVNTEVSLPCIGIAAQCVGGVGENGLITFTGTVTNCGNNTLVGVTVTNFVNGGQSQVTFITNLLSHQSAPFSGSWIPSNPCSASTATFTAQGIDQFTSAPRTVTSSANTTCSDVLTPGINVTKACPVQPVAPGQLLTFSGTITNTGNVTLTNIVVVDSQPVANTVVFAVASLAPGIGTNFSASYTAPTNCSVSDTLLATANTRCGIPVSGIASATCPIVTTPGITVTATCPAGSVSPGSTATFGGTVNNTGNITLTNIVVTSDRPGPSTPVFTAATLAPGASATFTGTYVVPAASCAYSTTFSVTGRDACTSIPVNNSFVSTCSVLAAPAIAVSLTCPLVASATGGSITYSGTVSNPGNVALTNVVVVNNQPVPNTPVAGPISLAPGASQNFTTTAFTTPLDSCSVSSTVNVRGNDTCGGVLVSNTATAICPLTAAPALAVRQNCPLIPAVPGGPLNYTGSVSNSGNITLTNVVVTSDRTGSTPVFSTATLAPGAVSNFNGSYTVPVNSGCSVTSTLTATGNNKCSGAVSTASAVSTCPVSGSANIGVSLFCPPNATAAGAVLTYTGFVTNTGSIALTNVVVTRDNPVPGTVIFTVASVAPGASARFTNSYTVASSDACSATTALTARANDQCGGSSLLATATITCSVVNNPAIVVRQICPILPASAGGVLNYSGSVSNAGNLTLTNILVINSQSGATTVFATPTLAPGAVSNFTGSYTVPIGTLCSVSSTATATGREICSGNTLTNTAISTCTLATAPAITVTLNCPDGTTQPGGLITYNGTVHNSGNIALNNVTVVDSQSSPALVLTVPSLAAGASSNFVAAFAAPLNACSVSSTVVARGTDACTSAGVTNTASATCPLGSAPSIAISENCASSPVGLGGVLTFSGTITNTGNITLTNVVVTSDRTGVTPILTVATLAAGAHANYSGSYTVPASNTCTITTIVTVTGNDTCAGVTARSTASATCPIVGNPRIVVWETCPLIPPAPGGVLIYSGTVSNAGNVTLTNVTVVSDRPATNTLILTVATLAPGTATNFTGSYNVPSNCCSVSSTLTAVGGTPCSGIIVTDSDTTTCPVLTSAGIVVTKVCPGTATAPGDLLRYSGTVSNSGNIALVSVTIVNNQPSSNSVVFGPITLAPGESVHYTASYTAPADFCGTDTVTARGLNACTLVAVTSSVTTTCPAAPTNPSISVTKNCPQVPTPRGGTYTFTGTVTNTGSVTLVNVFVVDNSPTNNTPVIGPITLAPHTGVNFSGSYTAPHCCCLVLDTLTATGQDRCSGSNVVATASAECPLLTAPALSVVEHCPTTTVPVGGLFQFTGSVSNTGNVVLTNVQVFSSLPVANTPVLGPIELAPGEAQDFSGSYTVVAGSSGLIVSASGSGTCQGVGVRAAANCAGPITPPNQPRAITVIINGNGTVSGVANGQLLNIGQNYTATATPTAGSAFVNWSGGVSGTSPSLNFIMQSNLVVIANFAFNGTNGTNVFRPVAGVFSGLFFDTNNVQTSNSGGFSLTTKTTGAYTGTIKHRGQSYAVKGTFDSHGQASNTIPRTGLSPLIVNWQGNLSDSDFVSGVVSDTTFVAPLGGGRNVFDAGNPAPQAGRYTLILPGIVDATNSPAGNGYGTVTVGADGLVHFSGMLADGTAVVQTGALSKDGEWPVYISLYLGKGVLIGWLQFADDGTNDIAGTLRWAKQSIPTSLRYKPGFSVNSDAIGSHYVATTGTNKMLHITAGLVVLSGGNLPDSSNPVTFGPSSKLVNNGPNALALTFTPASGLFSGTFREAGTTRIFTIKGAVLQRQNDGSGYSLGPNQSGQVIFEAAP